LQHSGNASEFSPGSLAGTSGDAGFISLIWRAEQLVESQKNFSQEKEVRKL
jgi:hypothetical protein